MQMDGGAGYGDQGGKPEYDPNEDGKSFGGGGGKGDDYESGSGGGKGEDYGSGKPDYDPNEDGKSFGGDGGKG